MDLTPVLLNFRVKPQSLELLPKFLTPVTQIHTSHQNLNICYSSPSHVFLLDPNQEFESESRPEPYPDLVL